MSEQPTKSNTNETNPRTMRTVAAILGQTSTDEGLRELNQTEGRNQSEQASFLAAQSPHLRDIYERGGTVVDDFLTVPKENLSLAPEIEIATAQTAVEKLTRITGDVRKAKELAPQLVEMGTRIAGSNADGETRLKVFGWLYRSLEGKQDLLVDEAANNSEIGQKNFSSSQFSEKWQQIVELSETLTALEPKDKLPEKSLDEIDENKRVRGSTNKPNENFTETDFYENEIVGENAERAEEIASTRGLIGFERIEVSSDLPKIPENLGRSDFEKLLEKTGEIDSKLENGIPKREIIAPFQGYVEMTRLDNELRLVEEEYAKVHFQQTDKESAENYRFVVKREELRELSEDKSRLTDLRARQTKITETIQKNYRENENFEKVKESVSNRNFPGQSNQDAPSKQQKIELTEEELELGKLLVEEKSIKREIETLSESITKREMNFRPSEELSNEEISASRKKELTEKALSLELPVGSILKEKYPELTPQERNEKLTKANTFEIQTPAEYLFVRKTATKHFLDLREREIKSEYRKFESKNIAEYTDKKLARKELGEHQEKISNLKSLEPVFAYKIEGSNKIIKAEPSERAVEGFNFVNQYIHYQLKQPETRLRRESVLYRTFADRLESAKTSQDVLREAYKIRQENHRAAGVWKNATKEERNGLNRHLSKKEISLLFLEQPVRHYNGEMSYLKYNFAHYSQAKEKMTNALLEGQLEPSAKAQKLIESLEARVVRRDLETQHKATKHFCLSLKTENEKLFIKNDFDHHTIYQNLPPHEKDWIYARAEQQKENLEYKIAYARAMSAERTIPPRTQTTNEVTKNLRNDFAAGTLWHQASILANQKSGTDIPKIANTDEKILNAIRFLIHNQTEGANLRVGEWLKKQTGTELITAGEILKTFAQATRKIEDNQMTVKVKITEFEKVSADDCKNLFASYFPADYEKLTEFRIGTGEKFRLEKSRRDGQTAVLNEWQNDIQTKTYRPDAPVSVFANELRTTEEIGKIKAAQIECRRSLEIQSAILLKTEEKLKKDLAKNEQIISPQDLKSTINRAFSTENSKRLSGEQKSFFEKVQDKILISDFKRFTESKQQLENGLLSINQSFENIATIRLENAQYEYTSQSAEKNESLQKQYESLQKQSEAELTTAAAREKFSTQKLEVAEATAINQFLNADELAKAQLESHRQTRVALEPAELIQSNQSSEIQAVALEFADALENVYQSNLQHKSELEINQTFTVAEEKRQNLDAFLKRHQESSLLPEQKPVTLKIYERELARNEQLIAQAKISEMIETGKISLADLETKKVGEFFSDQMREEIKLEAGERTRENLEPKELWAKRQNCSEKLQQAALGASDTLERAHEIYHDPNAKPDEISHVFAALDADILKLKNERKLEQNARKFINFKTEFKRDLAQMFENGQPLENPNLLTAMTKGLLLKALENQNIQTEKLGLSGEKLSEISRTITLGMVDNKRREKLILADKSAAVAVRDNLSAQPRTEIKTPSFQVKPKQFEHTR